MVVYRTVNTYEEGMGGWTVKSADGHEAWGKTKAAARARLLRSKRKLAKQEEKHGESAGSISA